MSFKTVEILCDYYGYIYINHLFLNDKQFRHGSRIFIWQMACQTETGHCFNPIESGLLNRSQGSLQYGD